MVKSQSKEEEEEEEEEEEVLRRRKKKEGRSQMDTPRNELNSRTANQQKANLHHTCYNS